jgi:DNA-binding NarL/FixJ family response regulator
LKEIGSPNKPLRIIVAEDESLFRDLLVQALNQDPDLKIVGAFSDGASALASCPHLAPHAAILDIALPGELNGIQVGLKLRSVLPSLGIVLLSNHQDPAYLAAVPPDAVQGWSYLLKKSVSDLATLRRAVVGAANGLVVLDPQLVAQRRAPGNRLLDRLTPRQHEVLALIAQGFSNAAIAAALSITPKSVENHINQLYQQLDIDTSDPQKQPRVSAVLTYLREMPEAGTAAGQAPPRPPR